MNKADREQLKKLAEFCFKKVQPGHLNFGVGNILVADGTNHVIAQVFGGPYNETPIDNMQNLCLSYNSVLELSLGVLELLKEK